MKILVINTGSSSIKYKLFDVDRRRKMASGVAEKIGEKASLLTHRVFDDDGTVRETRKKERVAEHREGMEAIVALLVDPEDGAIGDKAEITAVGHRVVHGGETFRDRDRPGDFPRRAPGRRLRYRLSPDAAEGGLSLRRPPGTL